MALNIKNAKVEQLATEVARHLGVSKSEAVRRALEAQLARIAEPSRTDRTAQLAAFLERDAWPLVPSDTLGRAPDKRERERILGYGEDAV
jgi:antitoxin VapB